MSLPDGTLLLLREGWLVGAIVLLQEHMQDCGVPTAPYCRVSCGFPYARRGLAADRIKGQCFPPICSRDDIPQIYINPLYDDSVEVMAILLHELIHCGVGCGYGHGQVFSQAAKKVGLLKPWRATQIGDGLRPILQSSVEALGPYPHAALLPMSRTQSVGNNSGSRLRLYECHCVPAVKARITRDVFQATCDVCRTSFHRVT